jgi:hypothetical protein
VEPLVGPTKLATSVPSEELESRVEYVPVFDTVVLLQCVAAIATSPDAETFPALVTFAAVPLAAKAALLTDVSTHPVAWAFFSVIASAYGKLNPFTPSVVETVSV